MSSENDQNSAQNNIPEITPDPLLQKLYGSERPAVELIKGVKLAPIICSCWPSVPPQELLKQTWIKEADEGASQKLDLAVDEYDSLPQRLSKTSSLCEWNSKKKQLLDLQNKADIPDEEKENHETSLQEVESQIQSLKEQIAEQQSSIKSVSNLQTQIKLT